MTVPATLDPEVFQNLKDALIGFRTVHRRVMEKDQFLFAREAFFRILQEAEEAIQTAVIVLLVFTRQIDKSTQIILPLLAVLGALKKKDQTPASPETPADGGEKNEG